VKIAKVVAGALLLLTLPSCGGGDLPPPSPFPIDVVQRFAVPVKLHEDTTGTKQLVTNDGVATVEVENTGAAAVTIARIDGFVADAGLVVTYIGHTMCERKGCIKTGDWEDADTQRVLSQGGIDGRFPIVIPPTKGRPVVNLIFRLGVGSSGMTRFRTGCLWLRALRVTLADGQHAIVNGFADQTILGAFAETSMLPGQQSPGPGRCPLVTPSP
jgi:hypothetical protein